MLDSRLRSSLSSPISTILPTRKKEDDYAETIPFSVIAFLYLLHGSVSQGVSEPGVAVPVCVYWWREEWWICVGPLRNARERRKCSIWVGRAQIWSEGTRSRIGRSRRSRRQRSCWSWTSGQGQLKRIICHCRAFIVTGMVSWTERALWTVRSRRLGWGIPRFTIHLEAGIDPPNRITLHSESDRLDTLYILTLPSAQHPGARNRASTHPNPSRTLIWSRTY